MDTGPSVARVVERFPLVAPGDEIATALGIVLRRLALCDSVAEVMDTVVQPVRQLLSADGVTFVLREGDLCHYAEEDAIAALWRGRRFPMDTCISGWCMEHSAPAAIEDILTDSRIPQEVYAPTFVRSLAMVPAPQDRPIAAIGAYWSRVGAPTDEALGLLQTLANAAAMAIDRLRERAERERREAEARESAHQLRNAFTMVETIARLSGGDDLDAYREALLARLAALREVRVALAADGFDAAPICTIADRVLRPIAGGPERLRIEGPETMLPERVATSLAFVLGELGTNALKHGSLSSSGGRVELSWREEAGEIDLLWVERGGPPAVSPRRTGCGSRFLEATLCRGLAGGFERDFAPEGMTFRAQFPVRR